MLVCTSFLRKQESSSIAFFWIPAGVYPVLDTGREWQIEEDICYAAINSSEFLDLSLTVLTPNSELRTRNFWA